MRVEIGQVTTPETIQSIINELIRLPLLYHLPTSVVGMTTEETRNEIAQLQSQISTLKTMEDLPFGSKAEKEKRSKAVDQFIDALIQQQNALIINSIQKSSSELAHIIRLLCTLFEKLKAAQSSSDENSFMYALIDLLKNSEYRDYAQYFLTIAKTCNNLNKLITDHGFGDEGALAYNMNILSIVFTIASQELLTAEIQYLLGINSNEWKAIDTDTTTIIRNNVDQLELQDLKKLHGLVETLERALPELHDEKSILGIIKEIVNDKLTTAHSVEIDRVALLKDYSAAIAESEKFLNQRFEIQNNFRKSVAKLLKHPNNSKAMRSFMKCSSALQNLDLHAKRLKALQEISIRMRNLEATAKEFKKCMEVNMEGPAVATALYDMIENETANPDLFAQMHRKEKLMDRLCKKLPKIADQLQKYYNRMHAKKHHEQPHPAKTKKLLKLENSRAEAQVAGLCISILYELVIAKNKIKTLPSQIKFLRKQLKNDIHAINTILSKMDGIDTKAYPHKNINELRDIKKILDERVRKASAEIDRLDQQISNFLTIKNETDIRLMIQNLMMEAPDYLAQKYFSEISTFTASKLVTNIEAALTNEQLQCLFSHGNINLMLKILFSAAESKENPAAQKFLLSENLAIFLSCTLDKMTNNNLTASEIRNIIRLYQEQSDAIRAIPCLQAIINKVEELCNLHPSSPITVGLFSLRNSRNNLATSSDNVSVVAPNPQHP